MKNVDGLDVYNKGGYKHKKPHLLEEWSDNFLHNSLSS